jgi:hypothetical protein
VLFRSRELRELFANSILWGSQSQILESHVREQGVRDQFAISSRTFLNRLTLI